MLIQSYTLRMALELDTNNHSVFSLNYHLVLVVKYRRQVFHAAMLERLHEMAVRIGQVHNVSIKEVNGEADHVHFLLRTKPNCDLSKYINALKSASSRVLKREFPEMRKQLWKEVVWSLSYCFLTGGGVPLELLRHYIESQGGVGE